MTYHTLLRQFVHYLEELNIGPTWLVTCIHTNIIAETVFADLNDGLLNDVL